MKQLIRRFSLMLILVLCLASPATSQVPANLPPGSNALSAGIVRIEITPGKPVKLSGYGGRTEPSTGVHDPLSARIVAFQSGTQRLVLVSTDLIGYYDTYEPIRDAICERFSLKPGEIFLSAIHTHSGPTPTLEPDGYANNVEYTQVLKTRLLEAVGQALQEIEPVQMGVGRGFSPVGCNRREKQSDGSVKLGRNPYGPTDKEVLVMKLARPDGTPLAALFDYATHATSLGPHNLQISGDVLGIAAQFVEKILAPGLIAPVFAGASGDIDPWYRVRPAFDEINGWIHEHVLLGTLLGEEVVFVFRDIKAMSSGVSIKTELVTLDLPAKNPPQDQAEDASATKQLNLTVATIGDVALVGVGCELLTELGMAIKEGSPFAHTFVISHCNGKAGYLPPKHLYGEGGYEIDRTGFGPEAGDLLVKEALETLNRLKQ